jgi:hypothetical protein
LRSPARVVPRGRSLCSGEQASRLPKHTADSTVCSKRWVTNSQRGHSWPVKPGDRALKTLRGEQRPSAVPRASPYYELSRAATLQPRSPNCGPCPSDGRGGRDGAQGAAAPRIHSAINLTWATFDETGTRSISQLRLMAPMLPKWDGRLHTAHLGRGEPTAVICESANMHRTRRRTHGRAGDCSNCLQSAVGAISLSRGSPAAPQFVEPLVKESTLSL